MFCKLGCAVEYGRRLTKSKWLSALSFVVVSSAAIEAPLGRVLQIRLKYVLDECEHIQRRGRGCKIRCLCHS